VPFSAGITIGFNSDRLTSNNGVTTYRTYISKVYDDGSLIASCLSDMIDVCQTIPPTDSQKVQILNFGSEGKPFDSEFGIFKVDKDYNLTIEVNGCPYLSPSA